jgi:putative protease
VDGRTCDHVGLLAGEALGLTTVRGKSCVLVQTGGPIARGDGVLIEGRPELGGRVWSVFVGGADVERAEAGQRVALWLGPDRSLKAADRPGARVWKTSDPARERAALEPLRNPHRVRLDVRVRGAIGEPPVFEGVTERGARATVTADAVVEAARTTATTEDLLRDKLGRLGDTPLYLGSLQVDLPDRAVVPLSALNRARRALVEALAQPAASHATLPVTHARLLGDAHLPDRPPPAPGLFVLCRSLEQAIAALDAGADGVVLDFLELVGTGKAVRALRGRPAAVHLTLAAPRIRKPGEEKIDRYLEQLAPDALLVRSLGSLHDRERAPDMVRIGDFSLNVANRLAASEVLSRGLTAFTPSFDLDGDQLTSLLQPDLAPWAEVVVHHPMPLFHMEHCVFAALLSSGSDHRTCGRPCESHAVSLRDRAGMVHPVVADVGCRNTVFHGAAQSAAGLVGTLQARGVRRFRIELVRESAAEVERVVTAYRSLLGARTSAADVWRTLRAEGRYGVVRGSLRVLADGASTTD